MDIFFTLVLAFGALVLLVYVGMPLGFYALYRSPLRPRAEPVDLAAAPSGPLAEARAIVEDAGRALVPLGFTARGTSSIAMAASERVIARLFLHQDTGDGAHISVRLVGPRGQERINGRWLTITTRLADGREVVTTQQPTPSIFTEPEGRRTLRIPEVQDPARLRRIHVALAHHMGVLTEPRAPNAATAEEALEAALLLALGAAVRAGELRADEAAQAFRPTLRGAFRVVVLRHLWPAGRAIERARREEITRVLFEVGER